MLPSFILSLPTSSSFSSRTVTICRTKRGGSNRSASTSGGGVGFGKPKPNGKLPNKRETASDPSTDTAPGAPQSIKQLDPETLRAEYEKRGIKVPEGYKFRSNNETDDDDEDDYTTPSDGTMPEIVATRMGRRIALFGGIPFSLLFAFFGVYFILTYEFEITVLPAVVAYSTLLLIGASGVGITYGIFSSSWDPEDEGSALGFDEAKLNLFRARDALLGLRRQEKQDDEFDRIDQLAKEKDDEENK